MLYSCFVFHVPKATFIRHFRRMSSVDIGDMRKPYYDSTDAFTEDQLVSDEPIGQFASWFDEARNCKDIIEPNAVCLATANKDGTPSARIVLLKSFGPEGFKFFTNYESRKGKDLIRIEGKVTKVPENESHEYFNRRPFNSRISAAVSPQSHIIPNRDFLVNAAKERLAQGNAEKPASWGGYLLYHDSVEFWQGQTDRLHDRLVYVRVNDNWKIHRLAP